MSLQNFFSLSPTNPNVYTQYDVEEGAPYARAILLSYGQITSYQPPYQLSDQVQNNEIIIGHNAVPTNNQDLYAGVQPYHRNTILIQFTGYNVKPENQYLLICQFTHRRARPYAQFFLGIEFLDMVEITGVEQHAILLDCLGHGSSISLWIRLASPYYYSAMGFNGVDCYLL